MRRGTDGEPPRAGASMRARWPRWTFVIALLVAVSGCAAGPYDGTRVEDRDTPVPFLGFLAYGGADLSGFEVTLEAQRFETGAWETIGTSVTADRGRRWRGQAWYAYSATLVIPAPYWRPQAASVVPQSGDERGYEAKVRARAGHILLPVARADRVECTIGASSAGEWYERCASHRHEAHIYTRTFSVAEDRCGAEPTVPRTRYRLAEIPACAQGVIYDLIEEQIDFERLTNHYRIDHLIPEAGLFEESYQCDGQQVSEILSCQPCDPSVETCFSREANGYPFGPTDYGGIFGGHRRYLRDMERRLMVYDYDWLPEGRLPWWDTSRALTDIAPVFTQQAPPPLGHDCDPQSDAASGCRGWNDHPLENPAYTDPPPDAVLPGNVCSIETGEELFDAMIPDWHNTIHGGLADYPFTVGSGGFGTMQSSTYPVFYLFHQYMDELYQGWLDCPR